MPALQRKQVPMDLRKAAHIAANKMDVTPMVKSDSQSSSDDDMDLQTPKQLHIPNANRMPVRYESDEQSVSPTPEDFEDARTSFSDIEFDSSIELDDEEFPFIVDAVSMPIKSARPLVVNISKLAPMEKRSTAAHVRPQLITTKSAINRPVVARAINGQTNGPTVVTLSKPPKNAGPPPIPARSEARTPIQTSAPALTTANTATTLPQRPAFPPRKDSHASRPSVSTIASNYDDDRSSVADSSSSSAPSSVADDADIAARDHFLAEDELRKDSLARAHDEELERAISDYMMWRSEGSPGEPNEDSWRRSQISPRQKSFAAVSNNGRRFAVSGDQSDSQTESSEEDDDWKNEIEKGLATPTPTSYAAYDPFNVVQPTLKRNSDGFRMSPIREEIPRPSGPINGLRRGFGMMKRNM